MKRDELIAAIKSAAENLGYIFHTGNEVALAARVTEMPAVWLFPPALKTVKGRMERRDTYEVKIRFMRMVPSGAPDTGADALTRLETDALLLAQEVERCGDVRRTNGMRIRPESKPSTPRGETGVTLEFEAEMFYCKYK